MNRPNVAVLLATYNGEKYLFEQIDSLINQNEVDVDVYIHDDFSNDSTNDVIKKLLSEHPDNINLLPSQKKLGVVATYQFLLDRVESDYYFFCDQDDVWYADKIIDELEILYNSKTVPSMVYSDLEVVDSNLNVITASMFKHMKVNHTEEINKLIVQNVITGNTVGFNRQLRDIVVNDFRMDDDRILMHDGWLGLVASVFGELTFLNQPTVKYRQHANNVVGAKKGRLRKLLDIDKLRMAIVKSTQQAYVFYQKSNNTSLLSLKNEKKDVIYSYATLFEQPKMARIKILMSNKLYKQGLFRNVVFFYLVITQKKVKNA